MGSNKLTISERYYMKDHFFQSWDFDENEKEGEGIFFIVYSRNNQTLHKFYEEAVTSAKRIKDLDTEVYTSTRFDFLR